MPSIALNKITNFLGNYQKDKMDALKGKFSSFLIIFSFYPKFQQLKPLKPQKLFFSFFLIPISLKPHGV